MNPINLDNITINAEALFTNLDNFIMRLILRDIEFDSGKSDLVCEYDIQKGQTLTEALEGLKRVLQVGIDGKGDIKTGRLYVPKNHTITKRETGIALSKYFNANISVELVQKPFRDIMIPLKQSVNAVELAGISPR